MPSKQPEQSGGYDHIKSDVEWGNATLSEKWQSDNLQSICGDGY